MERKRRRFEAPEPTAATIQTWSPEQRDQYFRKKARETPLADTDLSVRIVNALESHDILFIGDLLPLKTEELLNFENFGSQTIRDLCRLVRKLGIRPTWNPYAKRAKTSPPKRQQRKEKDAKAKAKAADDSALVGRQSAPRGLYRKHHKR